MKKQLRFIQTVQTKISSIGGFAWVNGGTDFYDTYESDLINVTSGRPIFNADLALNNKLPGLVMVPPKISRKSSPSFFLFYLFSGSLKTKVKGVEVDAAESEWRRRGEPGFTSRVRAGLSQSRKRVWIPNQYGGYIFQELGQSPPLGKPRLAYSSPG